MDTFCSGHPSEVTANGTTNGTTQVRFALQTGELVVTEKANGAKLMVVFIFTPQPCNVTVIGLEKCRGRMTS